MSSFRFGEAEIASKAFHKDRQVTNIFAIDLNKATASDRVSCSRAKLWQYILGYGVDEEMIILLSMKTPKNIFRAIMYLNATRAQLIQNDSAFLRPQIGGFKHLERG